MTACLALLALAAAAPAEGQASRGALERGTFAVTGVTVVPMTAETVIRDATVLVRDGRIAAVGPSGDVRVPAGARRIDGRGKYLIPGLADMHTHLYADDPEMPDSIAPHELGVMVANGLTAARLMIGTPQHLQLRRDIAAGRVLGPQLWVASPQFAGREYDNGRVVATPEAARAAVREVAEAGYDFVKLTLFISRPVYDAIVDEGARRGIRIIGHVDLEVGVARALEAGQQIEHLDAYFEEILADSAPSRASVSGVGVFSLRNWESLDHVDDRKLAQIAEATARAGVWSVPTLMVFNRAFAQGETDEAIRGRPDWTLMPPRLREGYWGARTRYWAPAAAATRTEARRRRYVEVRNGLTKAIADAGGKIMAGSDTPEWFHAYGFGLHRELETMVEAGLTPYQALATATRNPAEFLGAMGEWGTIEAGKRADLVLLSANPLEDIRNTARIEAVSLGGRWLERPALEALVRAAAERLGALPE
ncbi:MAG TPA: amidohydrolase family protein [Longimicrobiaceae bacterium]|nr:amidohydrolase family protein [Longimicrobiaceae bacterium]